MDEITAWSFLFLAHGNDICCNLSSHHLDAVDITQLHNFTIFSLFLCVYLWCSVISSEQREGKIYQSAYCVYIVKVVDDDATHLGRLWLTQRKNFQNRAHFFFFGAKMKFSTYVGVCVVCRIETRKHNFHCSFVHRIEIRGERK